MKFIDIKIHGTTIKKSSPKFRVFYEYLAEYRYGELC